MEVLAPGVTIRFVGVEAAELVRDLMLAAFAEYDAVLTVRSSAMEETVEDVADHIRLGGAVLAEAGGLAVGSGRFEFRDGHVYIGRLSVLPGRRGGGIGAAMMLEIERHAAERGYTEARIGVRTMLPRNMALYERLGYVVTARYQHPRGDEVIVDMAKWLNAVGP